MHRAAAASRRTTVMLTVAGAAGRFVGWVKRSATVRSLPGAAGAIVVAYGLGQIYHPLLWIALGAFCLILDNRIGG